MVCQVLFLSNFANPEIDCVTVKWELQLLGIVNSLNLCRIMFSDSGVPEGVVPLFLSSKTQEIFHCRCDEDVTEENPIKIITKQEILDDMRNRAAVCDFHPIKQEVIVSLNISISWNVMDICVWLHNGICIYQLYINIEGNISKLF